MTPEEMDEVRPRLEAFAAEMLGSLKRRDQRAKGELYLRGLMLDGQPTQRRFMSRFMNRRWNAVMMARVFGPDHHSPSQPTRCPGPVLVRPRLRSRLGGA
uniref:hypothetical protein n=1 Tax=Streptomyces malaysiensis TaxID=92644 RepID=UPI001AD8BF10|nr:hypothetical protein [Streptomyces malaysiensis]